MSKIALSGNASGTGTFTIASPDSSTDRTLDLPDAAGTIQVSGNPISGTTGTFTGLVDISAAGAGQIKFPATQNASANANTLDDYEEGTFTPTLTASLTNPTPTYITANTAGFYTKIGNVVNFTLEVRTSTTTGGSGELQISNLPFTCGGTSSYNVECAVSLYNITFNTAAVVTAEIFGGQSYFYIRQSISGAISTNLDIGAWPATDPTLMRITGAYTTS
jgi:hypothetical protein